MDVRSCMKHKVVSITDAATIREAAKAIAKNHIGLLPVVDAQKKLLGVIGLRDLLTLELPDFVSFVEDVDFVHDFGAAESTHPSAATLAKSVKSIMRPPITVTADTGLLRAYALLLQHNLHDMPVVDTDGKLVGVTSRVDIGVAVLSSWAPQRKKK